MLKHNIIVAFRNLWKYKTQSLISVIGLAVGFTCFALASLWLRYEMTYDSFHKNAKDTYVVVLPNTQSPSGLMLLNTAVYANHLKETFPEVKDALFISKTTPAAIDVDGVENQVQLIFASPSIQTVLDIPVLEGRFPEADKGEVAITKEKALLLYGDESPIGKKFERLSSTITAVVSGYSHSNFSFDILFPSKRGFGNAHGLVLLHPDVDVEAFKQKLKNHVVSLESGPGNVTEFSGATLLPITEFRYKGAQNSSIKFEYIGLFGVVGILVILCSLFNYITLFVARFRIRGKEFALRLVCGSSRGSLISLLTTEYLISLILSSFLGFLFVKIVLPSFEELSEIRMGLSDIYGELLLYFLSVLILSLIAFWLAIGLLGKRSLQVTIQKRNKQIFRKLSVAVQLFITIAMIFCSVVMIKQMHFLHNSSNIGFEFKNRAALKSYSMNFNSQLLLDKLKQIPEIEDIVFGCEPLLPDPVGDFPISISVWDDKQDDNSVVSIRNITVSDEYLRFYDFQLLEGELLGPDDSPEYVLINESAVKAFGWTDPIGKHFSFEMVDYSFSGFSGGIPEKVSVLKSYQVKGVVKNIYNVSSTIEVEPYFYDLKQSLYSIGAFVFKYKEGSRKVIQDKIEQIDEEIFKGETALTGARYLQLYNSEEEYDKQFKSETSLMLILNFVSLVCVLISVFGFFSLISLNLEERRREMAIRRVNGASPGNIMSIYFKEHFLLLLISSLLAFPIAYLVMKRWLEQYIQQTEISVWIYVAILFVITIVIVLCTGWRIWRSSRENPVETLKMS
ncbi:ABC transporter permease [Bacteroidales bacterium OttesenSCG-928-A17]|nr:ABC transporter permease [Bacteroidales bacterium OttesenSCG-928-A17]